VKVSILHLKNVKFKTGAVIVKIKSKD